MYLETLELFFYLGPSRTFYITLLVSLLSASLGFLTCHVFTNFGGYVESFNKRHDKRKKNN